MEWSVDVNNEARNAIRAYCIKRDLRCKGCRYAIDWITKEHSPYSSCIFANCPNSWSEIKED